MPFQRSQSSPCRPFVILALPRTGTKMVADAVSSHPDIPRVTHEFTGSEDEFWRHPYVLSNTVQPWMDDRIVKVHVFREDSIKGARSMLLMSYTFPQDVVTLPPGEVRALSRQRREWDSQMRSASDWSVSYESLTGGKETHRLPAWFEAKFAASVGLRPHRMVTNIRPRRYLRLRNESEICALSA